MKPERAADCPASDRQPNEKAVDAATLDRLAEALDTLPPLTRVIYMLSAIDKLPYDEISRRVRVSTDEIKVRMVQCLCRLDRSMQEGDAPVIGRMRRALRPLRTAWYAAREREGTRTIARWLPPDQRPGRRTWLDWIVVIISV